MKNTSGVIRYISVCAICVLTFIAALYNNFYKNGYNPETGFFAYERRKNPFFPGRARGIIKKKKHIDILNL